MARWLLGLGIAATLAANAAHGLGHGPVGAVVAAWPAVALVGTYELLMMIVRSTGQVPAVLPEPAAVPAASVATSAAVPVPADASAVLGGDWSYLAAGAGNRRAAVRLLSRAEDYVSGPGSPATRSWIAVRRAEETAQLGDATQSLRALDRALTAFDFASPRTERPWTGFFTASRLGSSTVTTYTTLNHREAEAAATSLLGSLSVTDNKVRGLVLSDLATAAAHGRNYERADELAGDAIQIATRTEASLAKKRLHDLALTLPAGSGPAGRLRQRIAVGLSASRP